MLYVSRDSSTFPVNLEVNNFFPLERIEGTVGVRPLRARWIIAPTGKESSDASVIKGYPELFQGRGKFVLCLVVCVHENSNDNTFPYCLPIEYFFNKREGEMVEITSKEKKKCFSLTCRQTDAKHTIPFEEMVEEMFMVTYNNLNRYGLIAEERQQWDIISELKQKHYPYSKVTNRGGSS